MICESVTPTSGWSFVKNLAGRQRKCKPSPKPPAVESSGHVKAQELNDQFPSSNNDRCIDQPDLDDIQTIISSLPSQFDPSTVVALACDHIIEQAILNPAIGSLGHVQNKELIRGLVQGMPLSCGSVLSSILYPKAMVNFVQSRSLLSSARLLNVW